MCWILWGSKMAPEAPPQCATIGATMAQHASLTSRRQCKTMASVSPPFHLFSFSSSLKLSCRLAWLLFCCGSLKMDQTCVLSHGPTCEHCKLQDCKSAFFFFFSFFISFETRNEIVSLFMPHFSQFLWVVKSIAREHVGWRWSGTGVVMWLELFWGDEDSLTSMLLVGDCGMVWISAGWSLNRAPSNA